MYVEINQLVTYNSIILDKKKTYNLLLFINKYLTINLYKAFRLPEFLAVVSSLPFQALVCW